jgi:hypothetical protein
MITGCIFIFIFSSELKIELDSDSLMGYCATRVMEAISNPFAITFRLASNIHYLKRITETWYPMNLDRTNVLFRKVYAGNALWHIWHNAISSFNNLQIKFQ